MLVRQCFLIVNTDFIKVYNRRLSSVASSWRKKPRSPLGFCDCHILHVWNHASYVERHPRLSFIRARAIALRTAALVSSSKRHSLQCSKSSGSIHLSCGGASEVTIVPEVFATIYRRRFVYRGGGAFRRTIACALTLLHPKRVSTAKLLISLAIDAQGHVGYNAAKGATAHLSKLMSYEFKKAGIRVNSIAYVTLSKPKVLVNSRYRSYLGTQEGKLLLIETATHGSFC